MSTEMMITVAIAAVAILAAFFLFTQLRSARSAQLEASDAQHALSAKLDETRTEVQTVKEKLQRKSKLLEEAKSEAKKRAKRDGKRDQREREGPAAVSLKSGGDNLNAAVSTLEKQIRTLKKEHAAAMKVVADEARSELSEALVKAKAHAREVEKTLADLRSSIKRKAEERPDIPGTQLDLKELPPPAVQELARYFRKGEEFERLYHATQGKYQLQNERNQELQKRYYAVCRELAVAAGSPVDSDADAVSAAKDIVAKGDKASAESKSKRPRRRNKKKAAQGELLLDSNTAKKADAPKDDAPKKADAPKDDAPKKADAPKDDVVKADAPKDDVVKADAPKDDVVKADAPKDDVVKTDAPKDDAAKKAPVEAVVAQTDVKPAEQAPS